MAALAQERDELARARDDAADAREDAAQLRRQRAPGRDQGAVERDRRSRAMHDDGNPGFPNRFLSARDVDGSAGDRADALDDEHHAQRTATVLGRTGSALPPTETPPGLRTADGSRMLTDAVLMTTRVVPGRCAEDHGGDAARRCRHHAVVQHSSRSAQSVVVTVRRYGAVEWVEPIEEPTHADLPPHRPLAAHRGCRTTTPPAGKTRQQDVAVSALSHTVCAR